jgi:RNA polymerase sigma factor (sigma-70 family)
MESNELIPHLFRTEFSKICAVLIKYFGVEQIDLAEDIASDAFLQALNTWAYKGTPENPTAWLYTVAKNKAKNQLQRNRLFATKISKEIKYAATDNEEPEIDLSDKNISDSQLQMLFAICHPLISREAQIGLSLRYLCGFGIDEIASAFLTSNETIYKRLLRAKEKLRQEKVAIEVPAPVEIEHRLATVLTTLYLLFSEGYYSETGDNILREDLCTEAMRLNHLLIENDQTNQPDANALLSLMYFHASRFEARKNEKREMVLYYDQDDTLWDDEWVAKGVFFMNQASKGPKLSKFHLEAALAYWQTIKTDSVDKWENVLHLHNLLLQIDYSPMAALNRAYAVYKVKGAEAAISETEKLRLNGNHFYFTLLGELYKDIDKTMAINNFMIAYELAKTETDKQIIQKKVEQV